jgi:hypothetical protein
MIFRVRGGCETLKAGARGDHKLSRRLQTCSVGMATPTGVPAACCCAASHPCIQARYHGPAQLAVRPEQRPAMFV